MRKLAITALFTFYAFLGLSLQKPIEIFYEKSEQGYIFYAQNKDVVPYMVQLNFKKLLNLEPDDKSKNIERTIPANSSKYKILELVKKEKDKNTSFDFSFIYTVGDFSIKLEDDYAYWLPYKHGKKIRVGQGNNGSGTHRGVNAIDFNLEIGDSIYAARGGVVFDIKEDSNIGGNNPKFEPYGNFIKIYHEDGTVGNYVHLVQNGSLVKIGDRISRGQLIGLSGNTGWSSGPHLHFMVAQNKNFQNITLPVQFLNYKEETFIPQESNSYYAYHPGMPDFEVQNKENFDESMYENKLEASNLKEGIQFDTKRYDDYYLIYVNNGMDTKMNGKLYVTLNNLISTKDLPFTFTVPAKTVMYLLALYPEDNSESFSYKLSGEFK
ncbi:M23 family metallopeptidase [Marivirga sp.]|uniref:M23 family metallopeptidase n=1 Tax=Marivirga sp. TaxID=2018662 RepID=UPI002D7F928C|nr:M23 family metallopeptidase [Marivirga sp.]HET8858862.1 M23 family metallopeptidase [Marivirga sp.]